MTTEKVGFRTTMKPYKIIPAPDEQTRPYWEGAKEGKLVMQQCQNCKFFIHPPQFFCANCKGINPNLGWGQLSGKGKLYNYALHHDTQIGGFEDKVPYILAIIQLDEQEDLMVYGNILNAAYEDLKLGMPLQAVWEDTDNPDIKIMQWRPA